LLPELELELRVGEYPLLLLLPEEVDLVGEEKVEDRLSLTVEVLFQFEEFVVLVVLRFGRT
jgi:hypothetical protein